MDWWQAGSAMATSVLAGLGVVGLVWRMMGRRFDEVDRRFERVDQEFDWVRDEFGKVRDEFGKVRDEFGKVRQEFGKVRQESGEAHDTIGARITRLGDAQDAALRKVHDSLAADIAQLRQGQTSLHEGLGEVRGELRGVTQSVQTLREDFRAHVFRQQD